MLLSVEDRLAILDLYARYSHCIDFGDAVGWAACFTDDATFMPNFGGTYKGSEQLTRFAEEVIARQQGQRRHWMGNLLLEPTEDGATGRCYGMLVATGVESEPSLVNTVLYEDRLT